MKLFLILLILAGGYCASLFTMTDLALNQLTVLNQTYAKVSATSDEVAQGNTSVSFTSKK